jgi:hypothetical protein
MKNFENLSGCLDSASRIYHVALHRGVKKLHNMVH